MYSLEKRTLVDCNQNNIIRLIILQMRQLVIKSRLSYKTDHVLSEIMVRELDRSIAYLIKRPY